jgi:hypothetical protein
VHQVGREVLAQLLTPLSMNVSDALHATPHADPPTVDLYGDAYVALLADLDTLVATDATFLLGSWLEMARNVGSAHLDVHPRGDGVGANATSATADDLSADVASDDCTGASAPTVPPEVQGCGHFYEWNARCQLTTWNPVPQGATKQPSGPIDCAAARIDRPDVAAAIEPLQSAYPCFPSAASSHCMRACPVCVCAWWLDSPFGRRRRVQALVGAAQ